MKVFLPLIALATIGATSEEPATPDVVSPPVASRDSVQTPVVDPDADYACMDDPLVVSGAEGEARLFRDPARPETLQPIRAVDYQVNGCGLLVLADGTLMRPPEDDGHQPVSLQPAQ